MQHKKLNINISSDQEGIISGYASVFNLIDEHNDIINKGAFNNLLDNKVKLLWQHKSEEPIGVIEQLTEDDYGLFFKARLLLEVPTAKAAYSLIKNQAISGVSIGFKPTKFSYKGDVRIIEKLDLWEISIVTFPANEQARVTEIKNNQQLNLRGNMTNTQQQVWEEFKNVNNEILNLKEARAKVDPLLYQQLNRINESLDEYKSKFDQLETSQQRPMLAENASINTFVDNEHKAAFNNYIRTGNEANLSMLEQKSLSAGSDSDGGYLVTRDTSSRIVKILEELSPMRKIAAVEQISTGSLDIIEDYDKAQAGWTAETKIVTDTDTPKVNKRNIPVFELFAQPAATQKLIDDSFVDIEKWLAEKLVHSFAKLESNSFIKGDGTTCPRGILTYQDGKEWGKIQQIKSSNESGFDADSLFNLYFNLKEQYCQNASFMMNRFTLHYVRTLKDKTSGRYLWSPGLMEGKPDILLGLPVYECADMPIVEKNSLSIALADFKQAYKIVDRQGIRILRDPYTLKPFVKFYTTKRVGGDVTNFEAIKLLKIAA
jgi:HK97 family phage major capsid protein/HK97 family phage prohead protease